MKAFVIMNESHSLLSEQEQILNDRFKEIEFIKVPSSGWTLEEMEEIAEDLHVRASGAKVRVNPRNGSRIIHYPGGDYENAIVFVSPVPFLLKKVMEEQYYVNHETYSHHSLYDVLVFHNDNREKKELPNGKIIQVVAQTGWQLV